MSKSTLAAGVCLLAFATYANALANGFVWDDSIILARQLPLFRSPASILFPPPNIPQFAPDYYRPLVIASYVVDHTLGGGGAFVFHLTVVLAHVLATLAVFAFGVALFGRVARLSSSVASAAAAIAAALFAVHPVHTEAVAWVAGRADVFAGLFSVSACWAHLRARARPRAAILTAVFLFLALLAKEVAIGLVALLPLLDALVPDIAAPVAAAQPRAARRRLATAPSARSNPMMRYAPIALALAVYALLRLIAVGSGVTQTSGEASSFSASTPLAALGWYGARLLLPVSLSAYLSDVPRGPLVLLASAAGAAAFAGALVVALRRRAGVVAYLLLWIAITLAPALTILLKIPEVPVAERYLYLPSAGFCLLVGYAVALATAVASAPRRAAAFGAMAVALLGFAVATAARNRVWSSDLALWTDTEQKNPDSGMPARSLGTALLNAGRSDDAKRAYEVALQRRNSAGGRSTILSNLGTIALQEGALDRAEELYRAALTAQATPDILFNLGVISLQRAQSARNAGDNDAARGQAESAVAALERAEKAGQLDPDIQVALGEALVLLDRRDDARRRYERALALGISGERAARVHAKLAQLREQCSKKTKGPRLRAPLSTRESG